MDEEILLQERQADDGMVRICATGLQKPPMPTLYALCTLHREVDSQMLYLVFTLTSKCPPGLSSLMFQNRRK